VPAAAASARNSFGYRQHVRKLSGCVKKSLNIHAPRSLFDSTSLKLSGLDVPNVQIPWSCIEKRDVVFALYACAMFHVVVSHRFPRNAICECGQELFVKRVVCRSCLSMGQVMEESSLGFVDTILTCTCDIILKELGRALQPDQLLAENIALKSYMASLKMLIHVDGEDSLYTCDPAQLPQCSLFPGYLPDPVSSEAT
jgi:hypothetical protein